MNQRFQLNWLRTNSLIRYPCCPGSLWHNIRGFQFGDTQPRINGILMQDAAGINIFSSMYFPSCTLELPPTPLPLPLLQRRNARIKSHKLPPDFFTPHHERTIGTDLSNRNIHTPCFSNRPSPPLLTLDLPRKAETAREQADLTLPETPRTSRVLRPAVRPRSLRRKQSLQCGREVSASLDQKYLRLPKILNKALMRYL